MACRNGYLGESGTGCSELWCSQCCQNKGIFTETKVPVRRTIKPTVGCSENNRDVQKRIMELGDFENDILSRIIFRFYDRRYFSNENKICSRINRHNLL